VDKQEILNGSSDEQGKKALSFKTGEELVAYAQAEKIDLSDELLNDIAGGVEPVSYRHRGIVPGAVCPKCGGTRNQDAWILIDGEVKACYECRDCG